MFILNIMIAPQGNRRNPTGPRLTAARRTTFRNLLDTFFTNQNVQYQVANVNFDGSYLYVNIHTEETITWFKPLLRGLSSMNNFRGSISLFDDEFELIAEGSMTQNGLKGRIFPVRTVDRFTEERQ